MEVKMEKIILQPEEVSKPKNPYSQGVKVKGNSLLFISGQVPTDEKGNLVGQGDIKAQTRKVFENLKAMLKAGGATFQQVVKLTIFLKNMEDFPAFTAVRSQYLKEDFPATTLVAVDSLVNKDWLVEIEAIAVVD
jgi:2-iminobutanoate/2-iminopropanoate deaminase